MLKTSLTCFTLHVSVYMFKQVSQCPLIWKQKKLKVKLAKYELLEKHNNLRLHSCFFVRKFRGGASAQSPLDHIFSQLVFYDQAKLRIFDSRDYKTNRRLALDLFFQHSKTIFWFSKVPTHYVQPTSNGNLKNSHEEVSEKYFM